MEGLPYCNLYRSKFGDQKWVLLGFNRNLGEGMDVGKCIVPSRHGDTLNSRRAASPLVRLVEGEERWEVPDHLQVVLYQNWESQDKSYCHLANGDKPSNFEPRSSEENDSGTGTILSKLPHHAKVRTLILDKVNEHQLFYTASWFHFVSILRIDELATRTPRLPQP
ncbi:uncharacterized protein TNCV_2670261 [Trichonephila clavipes]|nr:uncharacterized protein TNCV_2670261 [Trichonephila clavipes]